ncbi:MAG TPA: YihA family ribosome biogenesis GTP-binding protein [Bacteroidetes bacterium]|nr:YihA family ribosome biogenesis GTP-binding protein [Bacteroidota bacterium]
MEIKSVKFLTSSQHFAQLPPAKLPEYAFVGRSNVGKSSLINMLCRHKKLAKTSSTPGKTQLINHFEVDNSWYLVDLPGYGYARVSKRSRRGFERLIQDYITKRQSLISVCVLVDIRHEPQELDLEFMEFLGISAIPFVIVFTKADKLTRNLRAKNVAAYQKKLLEGWEALPPSFVTSAESALGREELLEYIGENMQFFNGPVK